MAKECKLQWFIVRFIFFNLFMIGLQHVDTKKSIIKDA